MFTGFDSEDFEIFEISPFAERMTAIKSHIKPKLRELGAIVTPQLINRFHTEFFSHVAAHMRRRVNPPPETWVAFGPNKRGYKAYQHFAIVIDRRGVYTRFILKSEAVDKKTLANRLKKEQKEIQGFLKKHPLYWFEKGGLSEPAKIQKQDIAFWTKVSNDLVARKDFNFDIGFGLEKDDRRLKSKEYLDTAIQSFEQLHFFYQLAS